ncbi:MAG TPA: FAD-binding oxidoreductase [Actinomycetota bacterium]|nr:FAD-binding oxidoreductase [Actinomycetota bacterium]
MPDIDSAALAAFRSEFAGEVILPGDPGYDAARVVWNGMIDRRPAIVARPTGAADVISSVRFARERELLVSVRSGGHSVAGYSTCDGGIVIDLSRMRGVRVDPDTRTARANGGALLAELDREAQAFGLVCPVGVVSHTGIAGLTLGGGMGRLMRRFGLTIDNLLSVDLVTSDGRLVHTSENDNADLFWGMRGAGPNFGIVTSFEFRLHPLDPVVTFGHVVYPIERVHDAVALYRDFVDSSPDDVFGAFSLGRALREGDFPPGVAGRPVVDLGGMHCGDPEEGERRLSPLGSLGNPVTNTIAPQPYLAVQRESDEALGWGRRFYMKSGFTPSLPDELVDAAVDAVADAPGDCSFGVWSWGRAIAEVPDDAMAFTGREAAFYVGVEMFWDHPAADDAHRTWGRNLMASIAPFTMEGRYVNDAIESGEDIVRSIYGDRKYDRLVALKRRWDPDNVFRLNQNIAP